MGEIERSSLPSKNFSCISMDMFKIGVLVLLGRLVEACVLLLAIVWESWIDMGILKLPKHVLWSYVIWGCFITCTHSYWNAGRVGSPVKLTHAGLQQYPLKIFQIGLFTGDYPICYYQWTVLSGQLVSQREYKTIPFKLCFSFDILSTDKHCI